VTQVVMNLVVNARDAMPNGGRLLIRLHEVDMDAASAERLHVVAGSFIVMDVIDEGVGMSEETQSHLFEPFFTTKPVGQGTGLGLSTVYGIVKASDGAIEVHSQEGAGTTMSVFWPRAAAPASTPPGERAAASPARVRPRVLIVEDDEAIRALLVRALEQNGYIVVTASDGDEGIAILKTKGKFDLLLTDLVMQGTGGAGVVAEARALAPTMKIVVASGFVGDRKAQGLPDDVVWLQKPFSAKDLLALLRPLLAGA
jgi:CheY-like chemotaxis protein